MLVRRPSVFKKQIIKPKVLGKVRSKKDSGKWYYIRTRTEVDVLGRQAQVLRIYTGNGWGKFLSLHFFTTHSWKNYDVAICSQEERDEFYVTMELESGDYL